MCGRFTLTTPTDELAEYFRVPEGGLPSARGRLRPRYNIAPTQPVVCVRRRRDDRVSGTARAAESTAGDVGAPARELIEMRWGLIPFWAKDPAIGNRMINARSESVADKPAYREAFRRRRCLVLADGFYEWKKVEGGKQPYFIHLSDHRPFAFAGLWERWKPREDQLDKLVAPDKPDVPVSDDGRVESCAFLTTTPNERLAEIHDRMPVILSEEHWETWLDPEFDDVDAL
ncbi:MAG: SOS response-associated peptidase, partial [Acidobacteriota bacterium]